MGDEPGLVHAQGDDFARSQEQDFREAIGDLPYVLDSWMNRSCCFKVRSRREDGREVGVSPPRQDAGVWVHATTAE